MKRDRSPTGGPDDGSEDQLTDHADDPYPDLSGWTGWVKQDDEYRYFRGGAPSKSRIVKNPSQIEVYDFNGYYVQYHSDKSLDEVVEMYDGYVECRDYDISSAEDLHGLRGLGVTKQGEILDGPSVEYGVIPKRDEEGNEYFIAYTELQEMRVNSRAEGYREIADWVLKNRPREKYEDIEPGHGADRDWINEE
jgi:hypothetical protein